MPQLNPDDGANDEPKTYKDEDIYESNDLNDIKGDLVDEDDGDHMQRTFESKNSSNRIEDIKRCNLEREQSHDIGGGRTNFPYSSEEMDSLVSGLGRPFFKNGFLPSSSQVPYSHYMPPYMGSFFRGGPLDIEGKSAMPRLPYSDVPVMYPLPGQLGQIPNPLSPWPPSPLNSLCTASAMAGMLRYPYPFHSFSSSGGVRNVSPFPVVPPHGNGLHSNMLHPGNFPLPHQVKGHNNVGKPGNDKKTMDAGKRERGSDKAKQPYVKKPLNAFMIYMKEQRAAVVAECTLKESAAINQILGRKWHNLDKEEQQKYYDIARKERQLHMQKHPSWSARDNYGKKKKRKKEKAQDCTGPSAKKCRAVFGLEQQQLWCAPCRRKKKCIRYHQDGDDSDSDDSSISPGQPSPLCASLATSSGNQSSISTHNDSQSGAEAAHDSQVSDQSSAVVVKVEKSPPQFAEPERPSTERAAQKPESHPPSTNTWTSSVHKPVDTGSVPAHPGLEDGLRSLTNSFSHPVQEARINRSSSNSDTSLNSNSSGSQRVFNSPLLSPSSINSHPNSPLLSNISYFAAAAGLPPSPLGGLMPFPNFNGLPPPLHMGLNPPGNQVGSVSHVQSSGSRLSSSALEGRS